MAVVYVPVAKKLIGKRDGTIEIKNQTNNYCLKNPKVFLQSGYADNPPQPTVDPLQTGNCTFSKSFGSARGSVGVLTYNLIGSSHNDSMEMLAIMFSVPFDYNFYLNWFAVGIFNKDRPCDEALYNEMYYDKKQKGFIRQKGDGTGISYVGNHLEVNATMSPLGQAIMKVEIRDK